MIEGNNGQQVGLEPLTKNERHRQMDREKLIDKMDVKERQACAHIFSLTLIYSAPRYK